MRVTSVRLCALVTVLVACGGGEESAPIAAGGRGGTAGAGGAAPGGSGGATAGASAAGSSGAGTGGAGAGHGGSAGTTGGAGSGGIAGAGGEGGSSGGADLAILTFNIRYGTADDGDDAWPLRKELVFGILRDQAADSVGVQEALIGQLQELDAEFPEYERVGVGRNDGEESGEFSPIFYASARLEVLDSGTFWFSDTPDVIGSIDWEATLPRICTWAHFEEKTTGRRYYHYNLHIDHASELARVNSVALLMSRVAEREDAVAPVIVTGDFNTGEASLPIQFMLGAEPIDEAENPLPLLDSFRVVNPDADPVGTFNGFTGASDGDKIDYVFSSGLEAIAAEIIRDNDQGRYPSDHFPVSARFDGSAWQ